MNKLLQIWKQNMTEKKKLKHIASVYIFNDKEEVLLIKRSKTAEKDPHIWEVPGGLGGAASSCLRLEHSFESFHKAVRTQV